VCVWGTCTLSAILDRKWRLNLRVPQITDGVKPTLSELEKFEDQPDGIDLEVVTESGVCLCVCV